MYMYLKVRVRANPSTLHNPLFWPRPVYIPRTYRIVWSAVYMYIPACYNSAAFYGRWRYACSFLPCHTRRRIYMLHFFQQRLAQCQSSQKGTVRLYMPFSIPSDVDIIVLIVSWVIGRSKDNPSNSSIAVAETCQNQAVRPLSVSGHDVGRTRYLRWERSEVLQCCYCYVEIWAFFKSETKRNQCTAAYRRWVA